ncbi:MAG TPA: Ig-like domain-containing protein [Gaiellaceae bacterium]
MKLGATGLGCIILLGCILAGSVPSRAAPFAQETVLTPDVGFRAFSYGSMASAPTAKDPQSKLWFNDGVWWGSLLNQSTTNFEIYRLDRATQTWTSTGTVIDDRDGSRSDSLWDGTKLYVVTSGLTSTSSSNNARVRRFSYNAGPRTYTLDSGFPVTLSTGGGMEAVGIEKDTTGKLWVTYTKNQSVYITHSTTSDSAWATPFVLPATESTGLLTQDESAIVSYNSKVGIMWSDQARTPMRYHFASHNDGDAVDVWQSSIALQGTEIADNHMNLKGLDGDSAGQVFAVAKTSLNAPNDPLYNLLVLKNNGTWETHVFGRVADNHTRAQLVIDRQNRQLYVMATSPCCSGGAVYYKQTSLDSPSFSSGLGTPFIQRSTDVNINNVSTTKQDLSSATGLAAVASDDTTRFYVHNDFDLGPDSTPPETYIDSGPSGIVEVDTATFAFSANESDATFSCSLDGAAFSACAAPQSYADLTDGAHTFQVRATDPGGNTDATPASRTWTVDTSIVTGTVSPTADARVESNRGDRNFGADPVLTSDSSPNTESFLKFDVNVPGPIISATLRLYVVNGTTNGPAAYSADNSWTETGITWNNKPARTGAALDDKGALALDTWAEYAVTPAVTGNGTYTFNIVPFSSDGVDFPSKESTNPNRPQLVVRYRPDPTAPETTIDSGPSGLTASASASFTFSADEPGSTFACSLDGAAFGACTSPQSYSGLAQGAHSFQVRATDGAGNTDPSPASRSWTVDTLAPQTTIDSGPSGPTASTSASFGFSADESGSFACSLDGAAFSACTSPQAYNGLAQGAHSFQVRATDSAGNTDPSPASRAWTVDTVAPAPPVMTTPANGSTTTSSTVTVAGTAEANSTVEVFDSGASQGATAADGAGNWVKTITGVPDGSHSYTAVAHDAAGNTSGASSPAHTITVDTVAPQTTIDSGPSGPTASTSASFSFSADESGSFACSLDGAAFSACTSPQAYSGLAEGANSFQVRATDSAGNTDPSPASRSWTVDVTAPSVTAVVPIDDAIGVSTGTNVEATFSEAMNAATISSTTFTLATFGTPVVAATVTYDAATRTAILNPDGPLLVATTYTATVAGGAGGVADLAGNRLAANRVWSFTTEALPDTDPPETTIDGGPSGLTASATASFTFSADEPGSTFACSLDGAAFSACTSPQSYNGLAQGAHSFQVQATDGAGNTDLTAASRSWTVDTLAPQTTIDSGPSGLTASTTATFTFSADEPGSTFACSLDGAAFSACTSPKSYSNLAQGAHTFEVRATDPAGNTDPTPASRSWTVSTVAPETTIDSGPSGPTASTTATFTFSADEPGSTFACSLDGAAFSACTSPQSYSNLAQGAHSFAVQATDGAGNTDPSPASRSWTVDTVAPQTTIDSGPSGTTSTSSATFTFSADESGSFACSLDGAAFSACASPQSYSGLAEGAHSFQVRATDSVGNTDPTPAVRTWTISLVFFSDGFESGNVSAWTTVLTGADGTATVQSADVKTGTFAARLSETAATGSFAYARKQLDTARTDLTASGDFKILTEGASGGNVPILRFFEPSGTRIISLYRQNLDGDKIRVTHSGVGFTTTGRLPLNTWGFFELHVITAGTASTVELKLNGQLIYQTSTASLGTAGALNVQIGNETKAQAFALVADNISVRF